MTGERRRILIVDDDMTIRTFLADLLAEEGYDVRVAHHGREALSVLQDWRADLILLDLMMPIMDGWTFRRQQLQAEVLAEIPVIAMSATHDAHERAAVLEPAAVLAKPFEMELLLLTVRQIVPQAASGRRRESHEEAAGTSNGAAK